MKKKQKAKAKVGDQVMFKGTVYTVSARVFETVNRHTFYKLTNKTFRGCSGYRPVARGDQVSLVK